MPTVEKKKKSNRHPTPKTVLTHLLEAWSAWWKVVGSLPLNAERLPSLQRSLNRFRLHENDEDVNRTLRQISQGKYLVRSALEWHAPMIGANPFPAATDTEKTRGDQWRLVMAYAGLERLMKSLLWQEETFGLPKADVQRFVLCSELPTYGPPLKPPNKAPLLEKMPYLIQRGGELKAFFTGRAINNWMSAICLAQGLRNHTTHGSLAPSNVHEYGMRRVFRRLTVDIGMLVSGVLRHLAH